MLTSFMRLQLGDGFRFRRCFIDCLLVCSSSYTYSNDHQTCMTKTTALLHDHLGLMRDSSSCTKGQVRGSFKFFLAMPRSCKRSIYTDDRDRLQT
jgi:hypothetical protein